MEELRIDCLHQTEEELGVVKELRQNIFRLNHTMPDTEEYRELLHKVFPHFGENCRIEYDRCRKSSQVNQENIDYGFFGKNLLSLAAKSLRGSLFTFVGRILKQKNHENNE